MGQGIRLRGTLFGVAAILLQGGQGSAQIPATDSLAEMKVAPGLEITLFAAEPDLRNPTCIDIDAQGRVWVAEAVNYRLFNQPIHDEAGDRIRVLEDTDGDGRCDKATTFYQDPSLASPMGIAVLGDRVYVCQSPDFFYLEDTDGDGKADKRTVILTGFGGVDHDHAIHGVTFAADGMLYMSNGDRGLDVTDSVGNRVHAGEDAPLQAATVLRTDLDGKRLEWLAQNMRNPYEPTVDSFGNVYISDNDDDGNEQTRVNYVYEGGNYGYWPRRRGDRHFDAVHWNLDRAGVVPTMIKIGFGSPCGMTAYEGANLPERLRGALLHADAGPGEVRAYFPAIDGAGVFATQEVLVSCPDDRWFRPVDVTEAPDGSIFIADWYDAGVGGHRMADATDGRIYRLSAKGPGAKAPALDLSTGAGKVSAFLSPNQARQFLGYEALKADLAKGESKALESLAASNDPVARARALWLLAADKRAGTKALNAVMTDPEQTVRIQAVRMAARDGRLEEAKSLLTDPSPAVRRQLLIELARLDDAPWVREWILTLAKQYDGKDRVYREAVGIALRGREQWGYEELVLTSTQPSDVTAGIVFELHPEAAIDWAGEVAASDEAPESVRLTALRAVDAIGGEEAGETLVAHATTPGVVALQELAFQLLSRDEGEVWRGAFETSEMTEYLESAIATPQAAGMTWDFVRDASYTAAMPALIAVASDTKRDPADRVVALTTARVLAGRIQGDARKDAIAGAAPLVAAEDGATAHAAIDLLVALRTNEALDILRGLITGDGVERERRLKAITSLARTEYGAHLLLDVAENEGVANDVLFNVTELLNGSRYEEIRTAAAKALPREATREGESLPSLEELMAMEGNEMRGDAVFFGVATQCAVCHRIGDSGPDAGPDLSKIGEKYGKDGLFEAILNPSAAISHEYAVWVVDLEDGTSHTGYVRAESETELDLVEASAQVVHIKKADIVERYQSSLSLMPAGLASAMSVQELVDLVAFLSEQK